MSRTLIFMFMSIKFKHGVFHLSEKLFGLKRNRRTIVAIFREEGGLCQEWSHMCRTAPRRQH